MKPKFTFSPMFDEASDAAAAAAAAKEKEIKDAQFARDQAIAEADKLKKQITALEGKVLSDADKQRFDKLVKDAETAEEARKRKEGEFDTLRTQLVEKHATETAALTQRAEAAEKRFRDTLIGREFAGATSLFGTAESQTVLTHDIAESYFKQYVDVDEHGTVVVKNTQGNVILDAKTGKPAPFAAALGELIGSLPNKDNILRGSGKAGSGSSGGTDTSGKGGIDTRNLKSNDFSKPEVQKAVKEEHAAAGGMVVGAAFQKMAAK